LCVSIYRRVGERQYTNLSRPFVKVVYE